MLIPNEIIETILDRADIVEVIGEFVSLKKKGNSWIGKSPFNDEKTPSFSVNPSLGIFKCFSSGISGGVVTFLKVHNKLTFPQAMQFLAQKYSIDIPKATSFNEEDVDKANIREELFNLNEFAASYFKRLLPTSEEATDYVNRRFSADLQTEFNIGYANKDWHSFQHAAIDEGFTLTTLLLSGLVTQNDSRQDFDFFRERVIFPIHNKHGRICAFAGRVLDNSQPKYLNIKTTPVFNKSFTLFNIYFAQKSISKLDFSVLVEGYTDVISLHAAGVFNSVAPCGTSFSPEQGNLLSRYSKNVIMLYDGDDPGQKAAVNNGKILIETGLIPFVVELPPEEDPDSYVRHNPDIDMPAFISSSRIDFPLWYSDKLFPGTSDDPMLRSEAINRICSVISLYKDQTLVDLFTEIISKKHKVKLPTLRDKIKSFIAANMPAPSKTNTSLPKDVDADAFQKWGFYEKDHEYYFDTDKGIMKLTNFTMVPLFHVISSVDTKRIFELTNYFGFKVTIDFDMVEMTSLQNFKRVIEGKGNFLFNGQEFHLMKLKAKLYEETKTCLEIRNLGWQREGFFAWANGISTDSGFTPIDETGLIAFNDQNYFIPAFSSIYLTDKTVFIDERKFLFIKREDISIFDWATMLIDVFDINAKFAIAFYVSALFRDHLLHLFSNFPLLNLFGPKGTGKSQLAMSLSCLFGKQQTPFNIHNGTKAGLAEHIQQFVNGIAWIDEYKNNIDYDKIETLKSIYDSIGRNRLNYDKGKKKETTLVNSAVNITGQEMMTADVALMSRTIFLQFHKTEYSAEEKKRYDLLKNIEKKGLSCITAEIITHRSYFIENYYSNYDQVLTELFALLKETVIEDRILRSWCAIIASIKVIEHKVKLPFSYEDLRDSAIELITNQNSQIASSNEISSFWDLFEALADGNDLIDKWHYVLTTTASLNAISGVKHFSEPLTILKIKFTTIYKVYSEHTRKQGGKPLPATTLNYYLMKSKTFLGMEKSTRFVRKDYSAAEGKAIETKQVTTSMCFDYFPLKINLIRTLETDTGSRFPSETSNNMPPDEDGPF